MVVGLACGFVVAMGLPWWLAHLRPEAAPTWWTRLPERVAAQLDGLQWFGASQINANFRPGDDAFTQLDRYAHGGRARIVAESITASLEPHGPNERQQIPFSILSYGLPLHSHHAVVWTTTGYGDTPPERELPYGPGPAGFPVWIDWGAFGANAGVFGGLIAAIVVALQGARRARRRSRSRCIHCGYALVDRAGQPRPGPLPRRTIVLAVGLGAPILAFGLMLCEPVGAYTRERVDAPDFAGARALVFRGGPFGDRIWWTRTPLAADASGAPPFWIESAPPPDPDASSFGPPLHASVLSGFPWRHAAVHRVPLDPDWSRPWRIFHDRLGPVIGVTIHWPALLANLTLYAALGAVIGYAVTGWRRKWRDGDPVRCPECGTLDR